MPEIPECLNRRYKALDSLIQELNTNITSQNSLAERPSDTSNVGIRLMCDFWNILKDDPDCNLTQEVQQRMCTGSAPRVPNKTYDMQRFITYMADKGCCDDKAARNRQKKRTCLSASDCNTKPDDSLPLSKVLCNLKEAASFDQKCHTRVKELMAAQKELTNQIQVLEKRENEGVQLLQQADCMWLCMEDAYKKKVAESLDRQKKLLKELKEVEGSVSKWRKNKKDLEFQIDNMGKARREINEKINHRKNDIKIMQAEISNFKKRIEANNIDLENTKKSFSSKKEASDAKIASIAADIVKIQKKTNEEMCHKRNKEEEGTKYVQEAREDLQKICKVLLQKKIENEDLRAEKTAIIEEIELLDKAANSCKDRCQNKENNLKNELERLGIEIANYKNKCIQCHACVDTNDARKMCTDCPRCLEEYECVESDGVCNLNPTLDCICMSVKHKFLDNVFDNMYTVLERQAKTNSGKAVADAVLECLRRNRNGKLTSDTRRILQDFILTTVKKNLNLTIVGGAVKTRCEMDPETYEQLMLCLNQVETAQPPKEDKGTASKKAPCRRWGGVSECHCPKGPKACVCTKKAPPPPGDPKPCPQDEEDIGPVMTCPYNPTKVCGPDCGMQGKTTSPSIDVAKWRRDPCSGSSCTYSKNMRAAQCILGPEALNSRHLLQKSTDNAKATYTCDCDSMTPGLHRDTKHLKADIGRFSDKNKGVQHQGESIKDVQSKFSEVQKLRKAAARNNQEGFGSHINIPRNICLKRRIQADTCKQSESGADSTGRIPRQDTESKQFKIAIENNEDQLGTQFTGLTITKSGKFAMELDEELIEFIEKTINDDPDMFVSLQRSESKSGPIVIVFDKKDEANEVLNGQKVTVSRTLSGTRLLEIHRDLVEEIQEEKQNDSQIDLKDTRNRRKQENIRKKCTCSSSVRHDKNRLCSSRKDSKDKFTNKNVSESSTCYPKPPVQVQFRKNCTRDQSSKYALSDYMDLLSFDENSAEQDQDSLTSISWTSEVSHRSENENGLLDFSQELKELYEKGNVATFQIETKKVLFKQFESVVSKSFSGTISADLLNKSPLERIPPNEICPVCLKKTVSGKYLVTVDSSSEFFNAVISKSSSGNIVLIPKKPQTKTKNDNEINTDSSGQKFFKLKVSGYNNRLIALPAVLKMTSSENYTIILDKEFEKRYKQTVHDHVGKERECFVFLNKIGSSYILHLNTDASIPPEELNALLVKSRSGNIKVLVHGPVFERIDSSTAKRSSISSAKVFGELLGKLQSASNGNSHRNTMTERASSDSQLHERVKIKLQINKDIFTEPPAILKKTNSSKYDIILNEETKKSFLNYLRRYLTCNPKGLVPVKRTDSGQMLIALDSDVEGKGYYGSLKITSSGNIHITVDAEALKRLTDAPVKANKISKVVDTIPYDYGTVNKAVTTTCNARPDHCDCDSSRCVCAALEREAIDWVEYRNDISRDCAGRLRQPMCWMKPKSDMDQQNSEACCTRRSNVSAERPKSPYIVIKPAAECRPPNQTFGSTEKCFYVIDTECQYHKNRYEAVSNELLEIPRLCNKGLKAPSDKNELTSDNVNKDLPPAEASDAWDSLSYLPPQLPPFLCDVSYR